MLLPPAPHVPAALAPRPLCCSSRPVPCLFAQCAGTAADDDANDLAKYGEGPTYRVNVGSYGSDSNVVLRINATVVGRTDAICAFEEDYILKSIIPSITVFHRRGHGLCSDILKVMPLPPVIFR